MSSHSGAQTWTWALHLAGVHRVLHWHTERTAGDWVTSIINVDIVVSWSEGDVLHAAAAVFVVLAGYFCLGGSLDSQTQTSCTSTPERQINTFIYLIALFLGLNSFPVKRDPTVPGLHSEAVGLVGNSSLQTWSKGTDPGGIASLHHRHSEGTLRHRRVVKQHLDQMHSCTRTDTSVPSVWCHTSLPERSQSEQIFSVIATCF